MNSDQEHRQQKTYTYDEYRKRFLPSVQRADVAVEESPEDFATTLAIGALERLRKALRPQDQYNVD